MRTDEVPNKDGSGNTRFPAPVDDIVFVVEMNIRKGERKTRYRPQP